MIRGALASTRSLSGAMGSTRGGGQLWSPALPTTSGGALPHTWLVPGVANFQDAAKTTVAAVTDPVGAAVNQGSDTYDIVQATAGFKPTLQQVTIGAVTSYVWRLDGTDDFLAGTFGGGAISQPFTVFVVAKLDATAVNAGLRYLLDSTSSLNRLLHFQLQTTTPDSWSINGGTTLTGGAADSDWNIWTSLFNGASSQFWHNGVSEAAGAAGATAPPGITVGNRDTLAGPEWFGDIGQILIYPGNLSTADKNQVGEYLERVTGIEWTTI